MKISLNQRNLVSSRKLAREFAISPSSIQGLLLLKNDIKLQAYKMQNETMLRDEHKIKIRKLSTNKFAKRRHNEDFVFRREIVRH